MAEPRTVRADANALNSEEIAALLPHRYPFALVDRILDYEPGQWAIGRKCVSRNEEFFCGHFPGSAHSGSTGPDRCRCGAQPAGEQGQTGPLRRHQECPLPQTGHPRRCAHPAL